MINIDHLVGIPWAFETADCFMLARRFYKDNWGIDIPDIAHPEHWEVTHPELDLLRTNFQHYGFKPVDVDHRSIRVGDGLLIQIGNRVRVVNHCAMYIGAGWFLHHPYREVSRKDRWAGEWRSRTMIVARHPAVPLSDNRPSVQVIDLLPAAKREKYRAALAAR